MSDSCNTPGCPFYGRHFSGKTCPECHKAPFRGNDLDTEPAPPDPTSEPPPVAIPSLPPPSKALSALVGTLSLLLASTSTMSCANHIRPIVTSAATVPYVEATTVQLHDAAGTAFDVPRERVCETRPSERAGVLIARFRFRSDPRFIGAAHFLRVIGVRNTTLALGFFTPRDAGLTACYLALERGNTIISIQSGVVERLSD